MSAAHLLAGLDVDDRVREIAAELVTQGVRADEVYADFLPTDVGTFISVVVVRDRISAPLPAPMYATASALLLRLLITAERARRHGTRTEGARR